MTEGVTTSVDDAAQRAAEQARLRKERREAKIKAGGSARLNKITGAAGRVTGDSDAPTPSAAATATESSADPDEVDISKHFYAPKTAAARTASPAQAAAAGGLPEPAISEAQLRQMMLGFERGTPGQQSPAPGAGGAATPSLEDDPMMKMMSQMMGGAGPGGPGGASPFANIPGLAGMMPPGQASQPAVADPYTSLWRVLHALVALGLGLYIAALTPFRGTKTERERAAAATANDFYSEDAELELEQRKRMFFWTFATAEAVLLTTRFFLDKSRAPPPGMLWTVAGYLPEPFKGYVMVALRYGQIFMTVRADILACIFVLGACTWWRG